MHLTHIVHNVTTVFLLTLPTCSLTYVVIATPHFTSIIVLHSYHINIPPHHPHIPVSPQLAPSTMAIQKASVREVLRKI